MTSLNEILIAARRENASDVHIGAGKPVIFRQLGRLKPVTTEALNADAVSRMISEALPKEIWERLEQTGDAEYVHTIEAQGRFRCAMIKQRDGLDLTARLIPMKIPEFKDTGLTPACANLTKWAQGMVLITGPAGCGKTTTLAVLIELINQTRHDHIITLEEPIEIVYEPKKSQITQREISTHTKNQTSALRAALREDPDILVVSELRDLRNIQLAISAAETGHLVFGTMNTVNAPQTISSLIDSFPADEQAVMRNMISESLRGVICQQLIPKKDGTGMVPAYEILIITPPVASLIRANKISQLNNAMATGKTSGMILMDSSLESLANANIITSKDACERATNPAALVPLISNGTIEKAIFLKLGSNGMTIMNELIQFGILESSPTSYVRLRPNANLDEKVIRQIAKDDFEKVYNVLQETRGPLG
jgi:twitching motility protein PilT